MRCKKHLSDSVGVCASCLRERLSALVASQAASHQPHLNPHATRVASRVEEPPPPLSFPRSVSPYVSRRKSEHASGAYPHRFYGTPQVAPTYNNGYHCRKKRNAAGKFSLLTKLFRSRSDNFHSDSTEPSSSWFFSSLFPSSRKNNSTLCYSDDSTANGRRACAISNRGMSPARESESEDDYGRSPWGGGESAEEWRRTPVASVPGVRRTRTTTHGKNASKLAFCLSPLVRPSPNRHWNQKGGLPQEMVYSGEVRKPHLSTAASFCANRSRKLADFGRGDHNR